MCWGKLHDQNKTFNIFFFKYIIPVTLKLLINRLFKLNELLLCTEGARALSQTVPCSVKRWLIIYVSWHKFWRSTLHISISYSSKKEIPRVPAEFSNIFRFRGTWEWWINQKIISFGRIWFLFFLLKSVDPILTGLPLAVAFLPDQRLYRRLLPGLCHSLLLLQAANHGASQHHPVLRIHHDHGSHLFPIYWWVSKKGGIDSLFICPIYLLSQLFLEVGN